MQKKSLTNAQVKAKLMAYLKASNEVEKAMHELCNYTEFIELVLPLYPEVAKKVYKAHNAAK